MKEAEFTGRSKEDALLRASQELGVNISDMTYEVLEEDTGLFGLFRKDVRVLVRVREDAARIVTRATYVPGPGDTGLVRAAGEVITLQKPERAPVEPVSEKADEAVVAEAHRPERQPLPQRTTPVTDKGPEASKVLHELLDLMDVSGSVSFEENEESVMLNVTGDDYETIVGKDGEVLAALQFLVNKIVNRFPEDRKLVVLDAGGFRGRREQTLGRLAKRLGDKAVATGHVVRLSPMTAQDRRLIHLALRDNRKVTTRSEGDGNFRRLLIIPAGFEPGSVQKTPAADSNRRSAPRAQGPRPKRDRGSDA